MDDDLDSLEAELKRLQPVAPSSRLERALDREFSPRISSTRWRLSWLALPAAAAITLFLIRGLDERTSGGPATVVRPDAPAVRTFKPIAAENVLLDETEDGLFTMADGSSARRIRQSYIDKITWENPATHASLIWTVPREEVSVVPVSFQ